MARFAFCRILGLTSTAWSPLSLQAAGDREAGGDDSGLVNMGNGEGGCDSVSDGRYVYSLSVSNKDVVRFGRVGEDQ